MVLVSNNFVVGIDALAAAGFLIAVILCLIAYSKTLERSNIWLIIGMMLAFSLIVNISNILEWANISSALDPAEDFLLILIFIGWGYALHDMK